MGYTTNQIIMVRSELEKYYDVKLLALPKSKRKIPEVNSQSQFNEE